MMFSPMCEEEFYGKQKQNIPFAGILLALGLIGVTLGVCFDGVQAVIANAIALCMSCIGLG